MDMQVCTQVHTIMTCMPHKRMQESIDLHAVCSLNDRYVLKPIYSTHSDRAHARRANC